jgi:hypothetical protein
MAGIIFHWELQQSLTNRTVQRQLAKRITLTCKAFDVKDICFIDVDGIEPEISDAEINFNVVNSLEDALKLFNTGTYVWVEQGGESLKTYKHPKDAIYIFGPDYGNLKESTIEIPIKQGIYADIACGIVLADRYMKNGINNK